MSATISKVKLKNYKRFKEYSFEPNSKTNILIGDNEAGKSTLLEAIDLVISGNIRKVENMGMDRIFNVEAVTGFSMGQRRFEDLPEVWIELYFNEDLGFEMNGKNNSDRIISDGIRLTCKPNQDYQMEIMEAIHADPNFFPFDYYSVSFSTFADQGYSGYKKKVKSILIDSGNLRTEYATSDFVKRMYTHFTESNVKERVVHRSQYRQLKTKFENECLAELNARVPEEDSYAFRFKNGASANFGDELMIYDHSVALDNKGTGTQIFVKTDFVLNHAGENIDIILIEEPENHLSYVKLRALLEKIENASSSQIFISTHNSYISTRLELKNVFILQGESTRTPLALSDLDEETAKYFMKTPPASIVEFALSNRIILVEGPAEYMLFDKFYRTITGRKMEEEGVQVLDVRGLSFKRYLNIAKLTGARVAVVTDNDQDYQRHCIEKYDEFAECENVQVFYESDNGLRTFEVVLERSNKELCYELFGDSAVDYMLNNKTEAAYQLLKCEEVVVPDYIKRSIEWIRS